MTRIPSISALDLTLTLFNSSLYLFRPKTKIPLLLFFFDLSFDLSSILPLQTRASRLSSILPLLQPNPPLPLLQPNPPPPSFLCSSRTYHRNSRRRRRSHHPLCLPSLTLESSQPPLSQPRILSPLPDMHPLSLSLSLAQNQSPRCSILISIWCGWILGIEDFEVFGFENLDFYWICCYAGWSRVGGVGGFGGDDGRLRERDGGGSWLNVVGE